MIESYTGNQGALSSTKHIGYLIRTSPDWDYLRWIRDAWDGPLVVKGVMVAPKDVLILHPGPMNRGVEIDSDVADGPHSVILNQVTNGVAVRMAVLYLLAGGQPEKAEAAKQGDET